VPASLSARRISIAAFAGEDRKKETEEKETDTGMTGWSGNTMAEEA